MSFFVASISIKQSISAYIKRRPLLISIGFVNRLQSMKKFCDQKNNNKNLVCFCEDIWL